jgi:virginiamycin A acetyltransferase
VRNLAKQILRGVAAVAVAPRLLAFRMWALVLGADRALESSSQSLAGVPGIRGQYLRGAFFTRALAHCDPTATICYGTLFSKAGARIDEHVYIGPRCHLGLVHLERDVLLAAGVHVPSGAATHGTQKADVPIREQAGRLAMVTIGEGSWIGSAAVVMANVGRHAIVGAGAVVTEPVPDYAVAVGVPARVIRSRVPSRAAV